MTNEAKQDKAPHKKRSPYRHVQCEGTVGSVDDAYSSLEDLASEVREIVENASEGLSQTQRIQTLDETASGLEALNRPDVPEGLAEMPLTYGETLPTDKRREPSRATRAGNYAAVLRAAADKARERLENSRDDGVTDDDMLEEWEQFASSLDEDADAVEGLEFPGMFG